MEKTERPKSGSRRATIHGGDRSNPRKKGDGGAGPWSGGSSERKNGSGE
jgi:hypothetical protein